LERQLGGGVTQRIVREGEIAAGLRRLRGVPKSSIDADAQADASPAPRNVPLIGDLLIERGYVRRQAFEAALTNYHPDRHGRIGDFMVACGVVSRDAIERVIEEQRRLSGFSGAAV